MKTQNEINHNKLVKRFHVLIRKLNHAGFANDEIFSLLKKKPMDMDNEELTETCLCLERALNPNAPETEVMRKKTIDSIISWMELYGREKNVEAAKIIACSESRMRFFNEIPINKLRFVYRVFKKKRNDFLSIEKVIADSKSKNTIQDLPKNIDFTNP